MKIYDTRLLFKITIDQKERMKCLANDRKVSIAQLLRDLIEVEWKKYNTRISKGQ